MSSPHRTKAKKVDALSLLIMREPTIAREARILAILRDTIRREMRNPGARHAFRKTAPLYERYRGKAFPLRDYHGKILPAWRYLSPWMKTQIATLAMAEMGYMQFKVHIHDDRMEEWHGRDIKVELRESISRHLRRRFGKDAPRFFFLMEDRTTARAPTRPHAHGSIEIVRAPIPKSGEGSRTLARLAANGNVEEAELTAGRMAIREELVEASGGREPRIAVSSGLDQTRNVWMKKPYHPIFNHQWVDYAFRNTDTVSADLGDNRLAMPHALRREAMIVWSLIRGD